MGSFAQRLPFVFDGKKKKKDRDVGGVSGTWIVNMEHPAHHTRKL
jgi:hypothetical protein